MKKTILLFSFFLFAAFYNLPAQLMVSNPLPMNACAGFSIVRSVQLSGLSLNGSPIQISPTTNFSFSTAASGPFTASLSLTYSGNTLPSTPLYIQFSPSTNGNFSTNIPISGGGFSAQIVVNALSGLSLNPIQTLFAPCFENQDLGLVELNPQGGTPPYSYTPSNLGSLGYIDSSLNQLIDVSYGAYTVQVSDSIGCSSIATFTVTGPSALSGTLVSNTASVCPPNPIGICSQSFPTSGPNGVVTFNLSGGTPPYQFYSEGNCAWTDFPNNFSVNGNSLTASGAFPNQSNCAIWIEDNNNCIQLLPSFNTPSSSGTSPTITATASSSSVCEGQSILINASGGNAYHIWDVFTNYLTPSTLAIQAYGAFSPMAIAGVNQYGCCNTAMVTFNTNPVDYTSLPNSTDSSLMYNVYDVPSSMLVNHYTDANCKLIASVQGLDSLGMFKAKVVVLPTASFLNAQPYLRRYYELTPAHNGAANVSLYFLQSDFDDYNTNNGTWPDFPTSGNNSDPNIANFQITKVDTVNGQLVAMVLNPTLTWNGDYWVASFYTPNFSSFIVHAVNPGNVPLPEYLTDFKAEKKSDADVISWTSLMEINNASYELAESEDGTHFSTLAKIPSQAKGGYSQERLYYEFQNRNIHVGHHYYELRQIDLDGKKHSLAQPIDLYRSANGLSVQTYPNPASEVLHVEISSETTQRIQLELVDLSGRMLSSQPIILLPGVQAHELSMKSLAPGIYTLQLSYSGAPKMVQKVMKQ